MKLSSLPIFIVTVLPALQVNAGPINTTSPNHLFKRSCGSTNYCDGRTPDPQCVPLSVGGAFCDALYDGSQFEDECKEICFNCVRSNCADSYCFTDRDLPEYCEGFIS